MITQIDKLQSIAGLTGTQNTAAAQNTSDAAGTFGSIFQSAIDYVKETDAAKNEAEYLLEEGLQILRKVAALNGAAEELAENARANVADDQQHGGIADVSQVQLAESALQHLGKGLGGSGFHNGRRNLFHDQCSFPQAASTCSA